jgi:hypothetical protein
MHTGFLSEISTEYHLSGRILSQACYVESEHFGLGWARRPTEFHPRFNSPHQLDRRAYCMPYGIAFIILNGFEPEHPGEPLAKFAYGTFVVLS